VLLRKIVPLLLLSASPISANPPSRIAELAWLEGSWEGDGVNGAPATEVYSGAADGKMVGHFRQLKADGTVMFYELITIEEANGSLRVRTY
jgi:Domain of unknown function (DUF6265)